MTAHGLRGATGTPQTSWLQRLAAPSGREGPQWPPGARCLVCNRTAWWGPVCFGGWPKHPFPQGTKHPFPQEKPGPVILIKSHTEEPAMSRDRRWHRPWAEPKVSRAGRPRARPTPALLLVATASCHPRGAWLPGCPGEQPAPPTAQPLGSECCFCSFGISGTRVGKRLWVIRPGPVAIARGGRATGCLSTCRLPDLPWGPGR